MRENELTFAAGDTQVQPDCFFRLSLAGRSFNFAFEIDNSTASVDALSSNSIRHKLIAYLAYQDLLLSQWHSGGKKWERPRFRVVFLTLSIERTYHILALAAELAAKRSRRLVYAAPFDALLTDPEPLTAPLFLDHLGNWQALVDLHPISLPLKTPVRLLKQMGTPFTA